MSEEKLTDLSSNIALFLMLPHTAVPFYMFLIWVTPEEHRFYWVWVWVWLGGSIFLHIINPAAGRGLHGGDLPPACDSESIMLALRSSILGMLPLAAIVFIIIETAVA